MGRKTKYTSFVKSLLRFMCRLYLPVRVKSLVDKHKLVRVKSLVDNTYALAAALFIFVYRETQYYSLNIYYQIILRYHTRAH